MIRSRQGWSAAKAEKRWLKVLSTLNEFQARLFTADKALDLGRGGISRMARLTGLSRTTITKAVRELQAKLSIPGPGRVREVGRGRKKIEEVDPSVPELLEKILEESTAGDPMSLLRWTCKSTRTLAEELTRLGHPVSWVTVARCLNQMGYSLRANRKTKEGRQHARRDVQFQYINPLTREECHAPAMEATCRVLPSAACEWASRPSSGWLLLLLAPGRTVRLTAPA
jgi:Rhodopirellula transposase DDE domain